jgi:hypothetical protein
MSSTETGKGLESAIKQRINEEYSFIGGDKIQTLFTHDMVQLFRQYSRDPWNLEVGQTLWFAVDKNETNMMPSASGPTMKIHQIPNLT